MRWPFNRIIYAGEAWFWASGRVASCCRIPWGESQTSLARTSGLFRTPEVVLNILHTSAFRMTGAWGGGGGVASGLWLLQVFYRSSGATCPDFSSQCRTVWAIRTVYVGPYCLRVLYISDYAQNRFKQHAVLPSIYCYFITFIVSPQI